MWTPALPSSRKTSSVKENSIRRANFHGKDISQSVRALIIWNFFGWKQVNIIKYRLSLFSDGILENGETLNALYKINI